MHWNRGSSLFGLGYTELFLVAVVTSWSLYTCDSVLGVSMEVHHESQGSIIVCRGKRNWSARNAGESGLNSMGGGSLMVILELPLEPGVYSRVMTRLALQNTCLFSDIRTLL